MEKNLKVYVYNAETEKFDIELNPFIRVSKDNKYLSEIVDTEHIFKTEYALIKIIKILTGYFEGEIVNYSEFTDEQLIKEFILITTPKAYWDSLPIDERKNQLEFIREENKEYVKRECKNNKNIIEAISLFSNLLNNTPLKLVYE